MPKGLAAIMNPLPFSDGEVPEGPFISPPQVRSVLRFHRSWKINRATTSLFAALLAFSCASAFPALADETGQAKPLPKRPTHSDLARRMAQRTNPLAEHRNVKPVDPETIQTKERGKTLGGLVERSTILANANQWTLVPKGSVLHVPPAFKSRVTSKPAGRLLDWSDFYARNRGWIFTQPVTIATARGEAELSEDVLENHRNLGRVVVAVLHNGPISMKNAGASSEQARPEPKQVSHPFPIQHP